MRRLLLPFALLVTALVWPSSSLATTTTITVSPDSNPVVCLDVPSGTTTATATIATADGTVLETLVPQAPELFACNGGGGRRILLLEPNPRLNDLEGLTLRAKGNDDPSTFSFRIPISRTDPTSGATGVTHVLALPTTSTVNLAVTAGPSTDITGTVSVVVTFPTGTANAIVNLPPTAFSFYSTTQPGRTYVQLNEAAPGIPVTVELRLPDGSLAASRIVPTQVDGRANSPSFDIGLPPGSTVHVVQAGVADRSRAFGDASFTSDGFHLALPGAPGCTLLTCLTGRFSTFLSLHGPTALVADPLGPCHQLAYLGPLPSECTPLLAPRTSITATGLLPVGGDSISLQTDYPANDNTEIRVSQRGARLDLDYGAVSIGGAGIGPVTGTLTTTGTGGPTFTRTLGGDSTGENALTFDGAAAGFPLHIPTGTTGTFSGPALGTTPLTSLFRLTAALDGTDLVGDAAPGARIRVARSLGFGLPLPDLAGTADGTGAFRIALGPTAAGTRIRVSAGDPATRALTQLALIAGRAHLAIGGVPVGGLVRGTVTLSATGDIDGPIFWYIGAANSIATAAPWTRTIDTRTFADGPLKVLAYDSFLTNYAYLAVDNTPPSGGAGSDQTVFPRREALILSEARDANGLASVVADFGDGVKLTQPDSQLGLPLRHRYAKVGGYKVTLTITDRAGNVTADTALIKVRSAAAPRLSGALPARASRKKPLRLTLHSSAAGTLTVRLISPRGRAVRTAVKHIARAGGKVSISFTTRTLTRGRYLLLRQLVSDDGTPGAILMSSVTVR